MTIPHKSVNGVVTEYSTTTYAYTYNESGSLMTQTSIDPNSNLTQSYFDTAGNITQIVHGKNAADPGTFEEVTTTRLFYNSKNLAYFTGITTGQGENLTWHAITLTWYDDINRITAAAQVNMDITATVQSLLEGYGQAKPYAQMPSAQTLYNAGHPVTVYEYDSWSGSPDRPYCIIDPAGQTQYFHYNQNNAQDASWTVWDDPSNGQGADKFVMNLAQTDDQERPLRTLRLTDTLGTSDPNVTNIYNDLETYISDGRAVILGETYYNSIGQTDISINADGIVTKYEYDAAGQLVETLTYENWNAFETHYQDYPTDLSGLLSISQTLYDIEGRSIVTVGPYDPTAGLPVGIETVYDDLGRVVETRRWKDVEITLQDVVYDDVVIGRKAVGWKSEELPPAEGNELSSSRMEYDIAGRIWRSYSQTEDGTEICTSEFVYDPSGRQIVSISLPDDTENRTETETIYDGKRRVAVIDARDNRTDFDYDDLGRNTITAFSQTTYKYLDEYLSQQTSTGPLYSHFVYDGLGRKIWNSGIVPDQETVDVPGEGLTYNVYDSVGRLIEVALPLVDDPNDGLSELISPLYRYYYNENGDLHAILDPMGRATVFEYGLLHEQRRKYKVYETGFGLADDPTLQDVLTLMPLGLNYEAKEYDSYGRLTQEKDFKGQLCIYSYDNLGRLEYTRYYSGEIDYNPEYPTYNAEPEIQYCYDNLGRRTCEIVTYYDDSGVGAQQYYGMYYYDANGRTEYIQISQGGKQYILDYVYSERTGRQIGLKLLLPDPSNPSGWPEVYLENSRFVYEYDELGRLAKMIVRKRNGYPAQGEITEEVRYGYNAIGGLESITYPNGNYAFYEHDALNRLSRLTNYQSNQPSASVLSRYEYGYYANGLRAGCTETLWNTASQQYDISDLVWIYDYMNRLVSEQRDSGQPVTYVYDLVGNRRQKTSDGVTTYSFYNSLDQLQKESLQSDGSNPTIQYEYDASGSLARKYYGPNKATAPYDEYGYNLMGRLSTFTPDGGSTAAFYYNPSGIRIAKTVGSVTTDYIVDHQNLTGYAQVLQESNGSNTITYLIGRDLLGQMINAGSPMYLLCDAHGSTRQLSDASGNLISGQNFSYDAYGNRLDTALSQTNYLYTGEQWDSDLQQYYNRERYYEPLTGRFNRCDTFPGIYTVPQSLHKYLYCHANPINGIDPTGRFFTLTDLMCSLGLEKQLRNLKESKDVIFKKGVDEAKEEMLDQIKDAFDWTDPPPIPAVAQYAETMWVARLQMLGYFPIPLQNTVVGHHGPDMLAIGWVNGKLRLIVGEIKGMKNSRVASSLHKLSDGTMQMSAKWIDDSISDLVRPLIQTIMEVGENYLLPGTDGKISETIKDNTSFELYLLRARYYPDGEWVLRGYRLLRTEYKKVVADYSSNNSIETEYHVQGPAGLDL